MNKELKHIILIGSMKSGTTTLYDHLTKHPEIAKGVSKEPEYFSINMGKGKEELKKREYADIFLVDKDIHKFTLDASTGYTKFPAEAGVPERIKNYGIKPYFIYIVRNPIERIKSHYNFMKKDLSWKGKIDSPHLINTSKYYMQLKEYRKFFSKEHILVVDFEELKKNPAELCNKIFKFIGASKVEINIESITKNKTNPTNRKQIKTIKKLEIFAKYSPKTLNKLIKSAIKTIYPSKIEKLSNEQISTILNLLKQDMELLKNEYNINTDKWIQNI